MTHPTTAPPGPSLEFRLLGPVEVQDQGAGIELGGSKPTGLLTLLLLSANRPVSTSALVDGLWGDAPPRTATKMVQVFVSRIRRQLGEAGAQLRTTKSGYQLLVDREAVDLFRFEALQRRATASLDGDPDDASALLKDALALWRGPALANVRAEPFAASAAARLEELQLGALEVLIDAELAAGRHRTTVPDVQHLAAKWPTRERFGEQLMLALYRCGRQAEALATAQEIRAGLRESLGIDPGPRLAQLELAILRQDPGLDLSPARESVEVRGTAADMPRALTTKVTPSASRRRRLRRGWVATAFTLAVVMVVALVVISAAPEGRRHAAAGVNISDSSVLVVDGRSASVLADVHVGDPDLVAVADNVAWVTNDDRRTVSEIRLSDDAVTSTYGLPTRPSALATTGGDVWVGDAFTGTVSRLFASTSEVASPFYPDGRHSGLVTLAADAGHLYTGLPDGRLVALNTGNLRVAAQTRLRDRVDTMAVAGSTLCAAMFRAPEVDCVKTPSLSTLATMRLPATPIAVACNDEFVWGLAGSPARLYRLDFANGRDTTRLPIPAGATEVVASTDYLWVLYGDAGTLLRLPLAVTAPPVTVDIGRPVASIATWGDDVLASIR